MSSLSFVIPTYNNPDQLIRCVKSIYKYTNNKKIKFEVIIVDDCSNKQNLIYLKKKIIKFKKKNLFFIKNNKNCGPAITRNNGCKKSKMKNIVFLDSDTKLHKDISKIILKRLTNNEVVVGHYHHTPINKNISSYYKSFFNFFHFSQKGVSNYETFNSACAAIKKKIFIISKGFDRNIKFGMDYENEEFGRRLQKKYKMVLDPNLTVQHEFPKFFDMAKLYFLRAIPYVAIILTDRKLESTGPGNRNVIISILLSPLIIISTILYFWLNNSIFIATTILLIFFNIYLNRTFYLFTVKKKPIFLPFFFILNLIFNKILFLATVLGTVKYFINVFRVK